MTTVTRAATPRRYAPGFDVEASPTERIHATRLQQVCRAPNYTLYIGRPEKEQRRLGGKHEGHRAQANALHGPAVVARDVAFGGLVKVIRFLVVLAPP
jgi:hypothetical protein